MTESGLLCPKCNGATAVYNSRSKPNNTIRRHRECLHCGFRFTTREFVADKSLKKVTSIPYDRYCGQLKRSDCK